MAKYLDIERIVCPNDLSSIALSRHAFRRTARVTSSVLAQTLALASSKDRWLASHPDREVIVTRSSSSACTYRWTVVLVEDDKGIARAHGRSWQEALEDALVLCR